VTDWVANRLRDDIVGGRLRPGEALGLSALANELKVSTTPVREALARLKEEGVVVSYPRQSFRVAPLSLSDIRDFHRLHAYISAELGWRATFVLSGKDIEELAAIDRKIQLTRENVDYAAMHALNFELHRKLNMATGWTVLHPTLRTTTRYVSRRTYPDVPGWLESAAEEHGPIIEALRGRNADLVRELITKHVDAAAARLIDDLRNRGGWVERTQDI
jgi:DNA-binding GntR family transcriptional regulator